MTSATKSVWSFARSMTAGVGGVGWRFASAFASLLGNQERKFDLPASGRGPVAVRLRRCPLSFERPESGHTSPPKLPSEDETMPMCMSVTGANSGSLPAGQL